MSKKSILLFLFVFVNYYNPISVYLTLIINMVLFFLISFNNGSSTIRFNRYIIVFTFLIFIWAMFIMLVRSNIDTQVLGKYFRVTTSTLLIMAVCNALHITAKQLIDVLTIIFLMHIISIGMQSVFPQLDIPMALFFGFGRESTIISEYTTRKMGCSSSYDTAALISVVSMVFFSRQYVVRNKSIYLLFMFLSFLASTRSSRTGMVLGIFFFVVLFIVLFFKSKGKKRLIPILCLLCGITFSVYVTFPILVHSTGLFLLEAEYNNSVISTNDYTTGTVSALTSTHLEAMEVPIFDLIIGFGIDPNTMSDKSTDIGYVKLIYHVGIIGLLLILLLYLYILRQGIITKKKSEEQSNEFMLSSFLILYILLIVVMNYKSLEMYSRGSHDLLLIIFFVLTNKYTTAVSYNGLENSNKRVHLTSNYR